MTAQPPRQRHSGTSGHPHPAGPQCTRVLQLTRTRPPPARTVVAAAFLRPLC